MLNSGDSNNNNNNNSGSVLHVDDVDDEEEEEDDDLVIVAPAAAGSTTGGSGCCCGIPVGITIAYHQRHDTATKKGLLLLDTHTTDGMEERRNRYSKNSSSPVTSSSNTNSSKKKMKRDSSSSSVKKKKKLEERLRKSQSFQVFLESAAIYSLCLILPTILAYLYNWYDVWHYQRGEESGAQAAGDDDEESSSVWWYGYLVSSRYYQQLARTVYPPLADYLCVTEEDDVVTGGVHSFASSYIWPYISYMVEKSGFCPSGADDAFAHHHRRKRSVLSEDVAAWTDVFTIAVCSFLLALIRLIIIRMTVPMEDADTLEAMVRCKSVHLLSSDYNSGGTMTPVGTPRGMPRSKIVVTSLATATADLSSSLVSLTPPLPPLPRMSHPHYRNELDDDGDDDYERNMNYHHTNEVLDDHDDHHFDDMNNNNNNSAMFIGYNIDATTEREEDDAIHHNLVVEQQQQSSRVSAPTLPDETKNEVQAKKNITSSSSFLGGDYWGSNQQPFTTMIDTHHSLQLLGNDDDDDDNGDDESWVNTVTQQRLVHNIRSDTANAGKVVGAEEDHETTTTAAVNSRTNKNRLYAAPRYATALFRLLHCTVAASIAWYYFHDADFWPWFVGGHGRTANCWDLSGGLTVGGMDSDFDQRNVVLKRYFLWQASYHGHSGAFHVLSLLVLMLHPTKHAPCRLRSFRQGSTAYVRSLSQHVLAAALIAVAYIFSSLRRLGAMALFAFDVSSWFLHLLQVCINAPEDSQFWRRYNNVVAPIYWGGVIPSFVYARFFVWPAIWYSATFESQVWLKQLEKTLWPGSAALFRNLLHGLMLILLASTVMYFRRLLNHSHIQKSLRRPNNERQLGTEDGRGLVVPVDIR